MNDPAQNKDDQNKQDQPTGTPPQDPVIPPVDTPPPVPPTAPVDTPAPLPDLPHDMPPMPADDVPSTPQPPISPQLAEEVPDPTSPPPIGADEPKEESLMPPIITPPEPTRSKAKIVGSILAILILVASIPAGIFLVQRTQEIREKACDPEVEDCSEQPSEPEPEEGEPGEEAPDEPGEPPAELPVPTPDPSCNDDVEYCDGDTKIHKHGGYWDGNQCVYAFDPIGSCESTTPTCSDDLEYCDQQTNKLIHKHGGYWDEEGNECIYAFDDIGACPDTRAHCSTANFWCANNNIQCGVPHKIHNEYKCDLPEQACCEIVSGGAQPPTGQCTNVKAYDANWNQLTAGALSTLKAGDSVRFAVGGSATNGSIDKARFTINNTLLPETSSKNPSGEYFTTYQIPAGITTFNIGAQLHHTDSGISWF